MHTDSMICFQPSASFPICQIYTYFSLMDGISLLSLFIFLKNDFPYIIKTSIRNALSKYGEGFLENMWLSHKNFSFGAAKLWVSVLLFILFYMMACILRY